MSKFIVSKNLLTKIAHGAEKLLTEKNCSLNLLTVYSEYCIDVNTYTVETYAVGFKFKFLSVMFVHKHGAKHRTSSALISP